MVKFLNCRILKSLDPFPGRTLGSASITYIIPDIEVRLIGDQLAIHLNDDWIPQIRINSYYINLLRKTNIEKDLKEYVKDKLESARYLLRNISSRRKTIINVVRAIMQHQIEFLKKGAGAFEAPDAYRSRI